MPLTTTNFQDLLDPRFKEIFDDDYMKPEDRVSEFYDMEGSNLLTERWSQIGGLPETPQFTGTVTYHEVSQGYDTTATHVQFAQGFTVERLLWEFNKHGSALFDKPKALAEALSRLRQVHRVRPFINAFSVDTFFYNNSEGVALCSNSHTTTSGASTTNGFDNYVTTALSATVLFSLRNQMIKHRNDQGLEIGIMPDTLYIPPDLADVAFEIVGSEGKPDVATNNANVHFGQYKVVEDLYLSTRGDTNNWYLIDSKMMKRAMKWIDHIKGEFGQAEEFDTLIGKWRAYAVWTQAVRDWRWISGADVA